MQDDDRSRLLVTFHMTVTKLTQNIESSQPADELMKEWEAELSAPEAMTVDHPAVEAATMGQTVADGLVAELELAEEYPMAAEYSIAGLSSVAELSADRGHHVRKRCPHRESPQPQMGK